MRRADRLFQIVQFLRGGRLVTAAILGAKLEVSERTIYRDIADLQASGVPIDGAAGVGYIMRHGFDLPPLMFTRDEVTALVAGAKLVKAWGGLTMARAAEEALVKIAAVLPDVARSQVAQIQIHAPSYRLTDDTRSNIDIIQKAVETRQVVEFTYEDKNNVETQRTIRPLGLWFWGGQWTAVGWCLTRDAFRTFRVDRMATLTKTNMIFKPEPGKTLKDFYCEMELNGEGPPTN